jgi:hypothetical protein
MIGGAGMSEGKSRGIRSAQKYRYWQEHVELWHDSGLSQAEYCRQNGLRLRQWNYWKKNLARKGANAAVSFVPVQISSSLPVPVTRSNLSLFTSNGYKVEVGVGFDPTTLKQLILTVQSL